MGKKHKKKKAKENKGISLEKFMMLNAVDLGVWLQEMEGKWEADKHSDLENYLHYNAKLTGR